MTRAPRWMPLVTLALLLGACGRDSTDSNPAQDDLALSGGETTVFNATSAAFSFPAPNLDAAGLTLHLAGDAAFEAGFVTAPAPVNPGLGPRFNNAACSACHTSDGRGRPPLPTEQFASMLFRISVPGAAPNGGPNPAPGFGGQIQVRSIQGIQPEATVSVSYTDSSDTFADATSYTLRVPTYVVNNPYITLPAGVLISPRVAPANFGLGLLEAVPEATLVGLADENDANGDGISGRPNYVHDVVSNQTVIGRFGLKANTPTLLQQTFTAYNEDMGVTSSFLPAENCENEDPSCAAHAGEVSDAIVQATVFYVRTLGVPARRNLSDAQAKRGATVFTQANCTGCHVAQLQTGTLAGVAAVSNQTIRPYTDLLLHDMGAGLADNRPDFLATGSEWRTPPLWGIGLTPLVNGHSNFLHDGRARSILEAIMWHGGEAQAARESVRQLPASDRAALVRFVESL